jgi:sec-independent protein translocase protein TatA
MFNISPQEVLLILLIALVVVGPQRLPSLGRSIGRGLRELRKAQDDVKRTIAVNLDEEPPNGSSGAGEAPPGSDPVPSAREPLPPNQIAEVSRTLGRGLREIRKARQEVERSFRVDLTDTSVNPSPTAPAEDPPDRPTGA